MDPKILKELESYKSQKIINEKQIDIDKKKFIRLIKQENISDIKNNDSYIEKNYTLWERIKKVLNIT